MIKKSKTTAASTHVSLNPQELSLYEIYFDEYQDLFPEIFLNSEKAFMSKLSNNVAINLGSKLNDYSKLTQAKVMSTVKGQLYMPDLRDSKKIRDIMSSLGFSDTQNVVTRLDIQDYYPHCHLTSKAYHTCGNELFHPQNVDYIFCLHCKKIFKPEQIHLYCKECKVEYFSCLKDEIEEEYKPATWESYHCKGVVDAKMRCPKCRDTLYVNNNNGKVKCMSCHHETDPMTIPWKCVICKEEFYGRAKGYHEVFTYKPMKNAIREALINKIPARPDSVPCCPINLQKAVFQHKKECKGVLYLGTINGNKISVCSECKAINYYRKCHWYCPQCGKKFKTEGKDEDDIEEDSRLNSTPKQNLLQKNRENEILRAKTMRIPLSAKIDNIKNDYHEHTVSKVTSSLTKGQISNNNHRSKNPISDFNYDDNELILQKNNSLKENKNIYGNIPQPRAKRSLLDSNFLKNINLNINVNININNYNSNFLKNIKKNFIDPPENFELSDFTIVKQIGEGTFGKIYEAFYTKNQQSYALKKLYVKTEDELNCVKQEFYLVMNFLKKHKSQNYNIIKIYGIQTGKDQSQFVLYVLMELASTDWEKEIKERSKIKAYYSEGELLYILKNIVRTMAELQNCSICHRDIKPQNIIISDEGYKICDFGEAKIINPDEDSVHTVRGTELYMSPLLFNSLKRKNNKVKHDCFKSDVFSLGLCMVLAGTLTFRALYDIRELKDMDSVKNIVTRYLVARYSFEFIEILLRMLEIDEKKRMNFIELEKTLRD